MVTVERPSTDQRILSNLKFATDEVVFEIGFGDDRESRKPEMRILFLRQKTLEVGQSSVANAGLGAQQESTAADENVESADTADYVVLRIDVEHGDDEVAEEPPRVAVKLVNRVSCSCRCRRCGETFEKHKVRFENFVDERLPQFGSHDLLALH